MDTCTVALERSIAEEQQSKEALRVATLQAEDSSRRVEQPRQELKALEEELANSTCPGQPFPSDVSSPVPPPPALITDLMSFMSTLCSEECTSWNLAAVLSNHTAKSDDWDPRSSARDTAQRRPWNGSDHVRILTKSWLEGRDGKCADPVPSGDAEEATIQGPRLCVHSAESLQRAFQSDGTHAVGLQETRIRTTGRTSGEYYDVISSAATGKGSGGVQLWLAQHLRPKVNAVEAVNAKILLASVTIGKRATKSRLLRAVAHTATECAKKRVKEEFWSVLDMLMRSRKPTNSQEDTLVLIDAKARTGSIGSSAIGRVQLVKENDNGMRFRLWMDNHDLADVDQQKKQTTKD